MPPRNLARIPYISVYTKYTNLVCQEEGLKARQLQKKAGQRDLFAGCPN